MTFKNAALRKRVNIEILAYLYLEPNWPGALLSVRESVKNLISLYSTLLFRANTLSAIKGERERQEGKGSKYLPICTL